MQGHIAENTGKYKKGGAEMATMMFHQAKVVGIDTVFGASPQLINAMTDKAKICPHLQRHYDLPVEEKSHFLKTPEALYLFGNIPENVAKILIRGFLRGTHGVETIGWEKVVEYFRANSRIIPALTENPGTYSMLEKMYHFEEVWGPIDIYFKMSKAGGQALRNRYDAVNNYAIAHINEVLAKQNHCLVIDVGSGPGRNGIDMCLHNPIYRKRVKFDCIDIDPLAVKLGEKLVLKHKLANFSFIRTSMTKLNGRYPDNVDYGLLIGILCGLTRPERIGLLRKLKPYFRKGARLMAASLSEEMAQEDLLCAYILRETTGWGLQYPPLGELREVFEEAGWKYEGYFQDEPTRFYEIGIGIA